MNKKTVKLNANPSLTHVRTQSACYELEGDLSLLMLNEIFHDSLKISKFTRICMENHLSVNGWQKLFFSYNSNFRRPMQSLLLRHAAENFNMLFQLLLTKFFKSELFSCLQKG